MYKLLFIFVCVILVLAVSSTDVTYNGRKYVSEGDAFNLSCIRTAYGLPKWTKDGLAIVSGMDNITLTTQTLDSTLLEMHLQVESARLEHRGEYKCDSFSPASHKLEVVSNPDFFEDRNIPKHVLILNETLRFDCEDVTDDIFQVNWYKDGHRLLESTDERIRIESRTLSITMATESDSGQYLCGVEVTGLSYPAADHLTYVILVTYGAQVEQFPSQMRPIAGQDFELECKVKGFPIPRIMWFVDDIAVEVFQTNNTRISLRNNAEGLPNAVFHIADVTYEDEHTVTCAANNQVSWVESDVFLAVRANMIYTNEETPGSGIVLNVGSNLLLQCNTTNDPTLNVIWYKDGNSLNMSDSRIQVFNLNNSLLVQSPTTEADTGHYVCATNAGEMVNATIVVRTKVRLQHFDNSRNIVQGQDIVLNCNVTQGIPLPTLQWFKDGNALNLSDSRIESEANRGIQFSKLKIKDADFADRAEYMCLATNSIDSANTTILIRVKDKYAALWPFLGICAEVAILCTIIFVYEKKRQKPDFEESEAEHNTENKAVPDQEDKSQDLRQRK